MMIIQGISVLPGRRSSHVKFLLFKNAMTSTAATMIILLILIISHNSGAVVLASSSCPEQQCSNVSPITYAPKNCDSRSLELVTLDEFEYNAGEPLVELLGPSDSSLCSSLVITATHGGSVLLDATIPDRKTDDPEYCPPSGCSILKDSNTIELSLALAEKVISNYCEVPYVVINHLHRKKLDANREINEAAQGNAVAENAWNMFHSFIAQAKEEVKGQHGTVLGSKEGILGVKGLLLDVHGYAGFDWDSTNGSNFIQWGYRLSKDSLDPERYCPLDDRIGDTVGSTISTFTHARDIEDVSGSSLECLIRGPNSIASRVNAMLPLPNDDGSGSVMCGTGLPSLEFPSPNATAEDSVLCQNYENGSSSSCGYFTGGYVVEVHENSDWQQTSTKSTNVLMNTVQAEFPRCLRFGDDLENVQANFAHVLSIALYSFMRDLYGPKFQCVDSSLKMLLNKKKGCPWVARKNTEQRCRIKNVASHCPVTCDVCSTCTDSNLKFQVPGIQRSKTCRWVGRKPDKIDRRCSITGVRQTCQATCRYCS